MMKITAFDGSPRRNGNSSMLLKACIDGAESAGGEAVVYKTEKLEMKACRGCLMCNTIKRCAMRDDCWSEIAERILESDLLIFSTPIYFHHASSSMKKMLDKFRSFVKVRITEDGIVHLPHTDWDKDWILLTAHGSSDVSDAEDLNKLFTFICETMGDRNRLNIINATRLAVSGQIGFDEQRLSSLYRKLELPENLAAADAEKNKKWLEEAYQLGRSAVEKRR